MPEYTKVCIILPLSILLMSFLDCTNNTTGIETTNGDDITVAVSDSIVWGTAPVFAKISVFNSDYRPLVNSGVGFTTLASDSGAYQFSKLPPGDYMLTAETPDRKQAALINDITISPGMDKFEHTKELEAVGAISGVVKSELDSLAGILVWLSGTGYYQVLSEPGPFEIRNVPPGQYTIQANALLSSDDFLYPQVKSERDSRSVVVPASENVVIEPLLVK